MSADVRERVDVILERFLREKVRAARALSPELEVVVNAAAALTLRGGKRVRPALAVAGFASVAPLVDLDAVCDAAASFELLQTFLLIQDDWMDRDDVRRGGPSVHALLRASFDEHRAASVAILASDLSCAWAFEVLSSARFDRARVAQAIGAMHAMIEEVVLGQYLDVIGSREVELVHRLKTAGYTVRWPLRLGALLGGASPAQLEALDAVALPLGIAFQIRDDLLGTFGEPSVTGKPAASDLRSGKETAIVAEARASLGASWPAFTQVLGRADADDAAIASARALLVESGVRARVESLLATKIEAALSALGAASLLENGRARIESLVWLIASRAS